MQRAVCTLPWPRRRKPIRSAAQHKYGSDIWRSIYYRTDWGQKWAHIGPTVSRVRRWALRKYNNPPSVYRRLKEYELRYGKL